VAQLHCSIAGCVCLYLDFNIYNTDYLYFFVSIQRRESGTLKDVQNSPTVRANGLAPASDERTFETAMK
jgi:hypothetical protein